ncbi:excisionase family DNA-binding protein [Rhodococcus sp. 5A-K4]|uniref:excisionase family DNA-binding protein n=1 Tax=Rhodococcus sp. 5A-K4 TaxID=3384442 RepID=UPI0038D501FC
MPKRNDSDEILTVRQVAEEWTVSVRTIQRYIQNGRIKAVRLPGGQSRLRRSDVDRALVPRSS